MQIIWDMAPVNTNEIVALLRDTSDWSPKTILISKQIMPYPALNLLVFCQLFSDLLDFIIQIRQKLRDRLLLRALRNTRRKFQQIALL